MSKIKKVCAYLDLLGFKYFTNKDIRGASGMLYDMQDVIHNKIADRIGCSSFDYFLPFSDSIFIQSSKRSLFIKELSSFLIDTFRESSYHYEHPEFNEEPTIVTLTEVGIRNKKITTHWFPVLFRGGVTYGECYQIKINAIENGKLKTLTNLIGNAVIEAVGLVENERIKGPRIICSQQFYESLNHDSQKHLKKIGKCSSNQYEILWPAFIFTSRNWEKDFDSLFHPAVNLWKAYNHLEYSIHYYKFIKLVIQSTLNYFSINNNDSNTAKEYIIKRLKDEGLETKINDLLNPDL